MEKLNKDDVLHVASLAKLLIQTEKYEHQLNDILKEIEKIEEVEIDDVDIMIAPTEHNNRYNSDEEVNMIDKKEVLKRANKTNGDFIAVSRVLND